LHNLALPYLNKKHATQKKKKKREKKRKEAQQV
jgi:hypothetical protein